MAELTRGAVAPFRPAPPRQLAELVIRAEALAGRTLDELAKALDFPIAGPGARTKGLAGQLLERALGATAGSAATPDFPHLGVELKTVPVDENGAPRESTFVCTIHLAEADYAHWDTSVARAKLAHVLFIPLIAAGAPLVAGSTELAPRRIGKPRFFRPTIAQERVLRADFDDHMGLIGSGGADSVTAHHGRWLQVRPKAATSAVRTFAPGDDGELIETGPRGFYLRRRFVAAVLLDAEAMPA